MDITETYKTGVLLNSLYNDLIKLEKKYGEYLRQEYLIGEVLVLKQSIYGAMHGIQEDAEFLNKHGSALMDYIKSRLKAVVMEQSRMVDESPLVQPNSSEKLHKASRALALVIDDAQGRFNDVIRSKTQKW